MKEDLEEGEQLGRYSAALTFDSTVLLVVYYAAETWADISLTSRVLRTTHKARGRCLLI